MLQISRAAAAEDDKKGGVSELIMMHLHFSTVNDGVKWLFWYKYDHNEVF